MMRVGELRELASVASVAFAAMGAAMFAQSHHLYPFAAAQLPAKPVILAQASELPQAIAPIIQPQPPQPPPQPVTPPDMSEEVALQVRSTVPAHLYPYFDVFLYVSKAASGPWAQHMFVFHKGPDGQLVFEQSFPVSTGREMREKYFTTTPVGMFELDPNRFDRVHFSHVWHNAPMPWAMFLNYTVHGHMAGIAIHSWAGHEVPLGQRASGGCVRMPPEKAAWLFNRFQAEEAGEVPVFPIEPGRLTTDTGGRMLTQADGTPVLTYGYKVLLIIQDYPGGPALVASLMPPGAVAKS